MTMLLILSEQWRPALTTSSPGWVSARKHQCT